MFSIINKEAKMTEAQKRAQAKYDLENRKKFRMFSFKLNRELNADVIAKLEAVDSMQGYIKELIRKDIQA